MEAVALVTAYNGSGQLLLGRRRDTGKWTVPGGHLNPGERPVDGARRELYEETGLEAESLSVLTAPTTETGLKLYCFSAYVNGTPHSKNDPDDEVDQWKFFDVSEGIPKKIYSKLAGPPPESGHNILTKIYDVQKSEVMN